MSDKCPRCANTVVEEGNCISLRNAKASRFEPDGLRWFQPLKVLHGISLEGRFAVCLSCGLVWSGVSPQELRTLLEQYGTDEAKSRLLKPR